MVTVKFETNIWYGKEEAELVGSGKFGRNIYSVVAPFKTNKAAVKYVRENSSAGTVIHSPR